MAAEDVAGVQILQHEACATMLSFQYADDATEVWSML